MPPAGINLRLVKGLMAQMTTSKVDVLGFFNSNGGFQGTGEAYRSGWAHGVPWALRQLGYQQYALGVIPACVVGGNPDYLGGWDEGYTVTSVNGIDGSNDAWRVGGDVSPDSGGTAFQDGIIEPDIALPSDSGVSQFSSRRMRWDAANISTNYTAAQCHAILRGTSGTTDGGSPMAQANTTYKYVLTYGTFVSGGETRMWTSGRKAQTSNYASDGGVTPWAEVNTNTGAESVARVTIDVRTALTTGLGLWSGVDGAGIYALDLPIIHYYRRVYDPAKTVGFSYNHGSSAGGLGMREIAILLGCAENNGNGVARLGMPATQLAQWLREILHLQADPTRPKLLIIFGDRLNGRNDGIGATADLSVGGGAYNPQTQARLAALDNCTAIYNKVEQALTDIGVVDRSNVIYCCWGEHATATAMTAVESAILDGMMDFARAYPTRAAYIAPAEIVPAATMSASGFWDTATGVPATDSVHLKRDGFRNVAIEALGYAKDYRDDSGSGDDEAALLLLLGRAA